MEKMIDRGSLWSFYGSYNLPVYISLDWGERQREFVWGGEIEHTGSGEFTSTCPNPDGGINPPLQETGARGTMAKSGGGGRFVDARNQRHRKSRGP
jgi:hypothetical protein